MQLWGALASKPRLLPDVWPVTWAMCDLWRPIGDRPTRNRDLHSFSARLIRDAAPGTTDFEIEGIYQSGDISASLAGNAATQDVAAYFVHADIGHTFDSAWRPRLSVEYDYASGNGPGCGYRSLRHACSACGARTWRLRESMPRWVGPICKRIGLRLETIASSRLDGFVTYRALWAAAGTDSFSTTGVRDPTGAAGRFAGYQLDTRVRYWIIPQSLRAEFNGVWLDQTGTAARSAECPTLWRHAVRLIRADIVILMKRTGSRIFV